MWEPAEYISYQWSPQMGHGRESHVQYPSCAYLTFVLKAICQNNFTSFTDN